MRRKDILIISAIIVIISFITVFTIYFLKNDGNIFGKIKEEITEIANGDDEYHSNGWEKAVVNEIKYKVPIPVGFTYVEGKKNEGLIIKNDQTGEEYVWVPREEIVIGEEEYTELIVDLGLEEAKEEQEESTEKYEGFYVAIDRDAKADTNQIKEKLKNMTVEERRKLELDNESKTSIAETHTVTIDELASIVSWDSEIKNLINIDKMQALTLSASKEEDIKIQVESNKDRIYYAIKYISNVTDTSEEIVKKNVGYNSETDYNTNEAAYKKIRTEIIEQVRTNELQSKKITDILDNGIVYREDIEDTLTYEDVINKNKEYNSRIELAINYISEKEGISESEVKKDINDKSENAYDDFVKLESELNKNSNQGELSEIDNSTEKIYSDIREVIISNYCTESEEEANKLKRILDSNTNNEIDSRVATKHKTEDVYIPAGFEYVSGTEETGFKIKNRDNLRFVWIPVKKENGEKYETPEEVEKAVKDEFLGNAKDADIEEEKYNAFADSEDRQSDEYTKLLESIVKYGGFYISEAELGYDDNGNKINTYRKMENSYVVNGDYYRNVEEGNIKKGTAIEEKQNKFKLEYGKAEDISASLYGNSVSAESHLTYGLEYNATVNYLIKTGAITEEEAFENSYDIGKYAGKHVWEEKSDLNGIYGLAGNLAEITQEVYKDENEEEKIVVRGGDWATEKSEENGKTNLALSEGYSESDIKEDEKGTVGFRVCLYIKTEYEGVYLTNEVETQINSLKEYIAGKSVKIEGDETNYFNTNGKVVNTIVNSIEGMLKEEKSTAAMPEITQYGKDSVDLLVNHIDNLMNYNDITVQLENEKTLKVNDVCLHIKEEVIKEIGNLKWRKGKLTNEKGKETTYQTIVDSTKNLINAFMGQGGENVSYVYEGEWKEGIPDGWVKITYGDNGTYEGGFKDAKAYGYGEFTDKNNKVIKAFWNIDAGEESGTNSFEYKLTYGGGGTYVVKSVSVSDKYYTIENIQISSSILTPTPTTSTSESESEYVYIGEYKEGIPDGKVKITYSNGNVYDGGWKNGRQDGYGELTFGRDSGWYGVWDGYWTENGFSGDDSRIEEAGEYKSIMELINGITLEGATEEETNRFNTAKGNLINTVDNSINIKGMYLAEIFYWTQPSSWDYKELWETEYIIWKINGMTGIIKGEIDPENELSNINQMIAGVVAEKNAEASSSSIIEIIDGITLEGATEEQINRFNTAKENLTNTINNTENVEGIKAAESFYWTEPSSWEHSGVWLTEYIIWKINGMTGIITGDIDSEKEMEDINNWIKVKQDIVQIAERFKYGIEEYQAADYSYYESWKDTEQSMRNSGYANIIEADTVENAKERATYQLGLINQMIAEEITKKQAESGQTYDDDRTGGDTGGDGGDYKPEISGNIPEGERQELPIRRINVGESFNPEPIHGKEWISSDTSIVQITKVNENFVSVDGIKEGSVVIYNEHFKQTVQVIDQSKNPFLSETNVIYIGEGDKSVFGTGEELEATTAKLKKVNSMYWDINYIAVVLSEDSPSIATNVNSSGYPVVRFEQYTTYKFRVYFSNGNWKDYTVIVEEESRYDKICNFIKNNIDAATNITGEEGNEWDISFELWGKKYMRLSGNGVRFISMQTFDKIDGEKVGKQSRSFWSPWSRLPYKNELLQLATNHSGLVSTKKKEWVDEDAPGGKMKQYAEFFVKGSLVEYGDYTGGWFGNSNEAYRIVFDFGEKPFE